jgi:pimeloyl-ACP methyl ester carboxylesterase
MRKAFVIPGCGKEAIEYTNLSRMLRDKAYVPVPVNIDWSTGSFKEYVRQAQSQLDELGPGDVLIGFSYGANISLLVGNHVDRTRVCCSAPDIFNKDKRDLFDMLSKPVNVKINWGEVDQLILRNQVASNTYLIAGDREGSYTDFAKSLAEKAGAKFKIIHGAGHDINSHAYVKGIAQLV